MAWKQSKAKGRTVRQASVDRAVSNGRRPGSIVSGRASASANGCQVCSGSGARSRRVNGAECIVCAPCARRLARG